MGASRVLVWKLGKHEDVGYPLTFMELGVGNYRSRMLCEKGSIVFLSVSVNVCEKAL